MVDTLCADGSSIAQKRWGNYRNSLTSLFPIADETTDHADYGIGYHSRLFGSGRAPT